VRQRIAKRVADLPTYGFGPASDPWWGAMGFIALEGMGFALAIGTYLYLLVTNPKWPLSSPPPDLWAGSLATVVFILSVIPNQLTNRVALRLDLRATRIWLVVMSLIGIVLLVIRGFEFAHLNTRWDFDAYGSVVWVILGLHTTHLATDLGDTLVLTVLMFTRHATARRFSDVTDNVFYWNFVVLAWLPLYVLLYWVPRL
jgi:heme/copper-type cytochrome/quinol oxidase subunit 3